MAATTAGWHRPSSRLAALVRGLVVLLILVTACATTSPDPTTAPTTRPDTDLPAPGDGPDVAPPDTSFDPPLDGSLLDWDDPDATVAMGNGWTVHACFGDAPLMCFDHDGSEVAAIEAHPYPIDSFDALDPAAGDAENMEAFAAAFLAEFSADRAAGCGDDYRFEVIEPHPMQLGGRAGIAYGFVGTMPGGEPSEVQLQYATIRDDQVLLLNAQAYDDGGCLPPFEAGSFTSAQLLEIRQDLESLLTDIPLPQLPTPPVTP